MRYFHIKIITILIFSLYFLHSLDGQWELLNGPVNDYWISNIAINEEYIWAGTVWDGIWKQNKISGQWEKITSLPDSIFALDIITQDEIVFILDYQNNIYSSKDKGISWSNISPQNMNSEFSEIYIDSSSILIGGNIDLNSSQLYVNNDTGNVWEPYKFNVGNEIIWPSMYTRKGNTIFTATVEKIYRSIDNGGVWEELLNSPVFEVGCPLCEIVKLFTSDSMVLALEMNDYYHSTRLHVSMDNGDNWEIMDLGYPSSGFNAGFNWFTSIDNILLALDYSQHEGIYVSFDGGHSSVLFNDGLSTNRVRDIASDSDYMYAGTAGYGVWRRKISDLYTTSIESTFQNDELSIYPNPSGGSFKLKLTSNFSGKATLLITDLNGKICLQRKIELIPEIQVDAENLTSGLYFLSVRSGEKVFTAKMVVQK
jgi:hypothetical protein